MNSRLMSKLGKQLLFFDGGLGTLLQAHGLTGGELPEVWNITHPNVVIEIHKEYIKAGSSIISTNTFGANSVKLKDSGYSVADLVKGGISNAVSAKEQTSSDAMIALSFGTIGKLLAPVGEVSFEDAYSLYKEIVISADHSLLDCIIIETMCDTYDVKAAALAARENSDLPIIVTLTFDEHGKLLTGADIKTAVCLLESLGVDVLGLNCGLGPIQMRDLVEELSELTSTPILLNPNAGLPSIINGDTVFSLTPKAFAEAMMPLLIDGVYLIGGCCGTTPEHIKELTSRYKNHKLSPIKDKNRTVISSYSKSVVIGSSPIIIGERINPTGKPRLKQALRDQDLDYIYREAIEQTDCGAHILDVNVGTPEINESELMPQVILGLQSITDTPLQIDTSNIEAMENALRVYNGRALVNSVNGKQESMDAVFPIVKKYGAAVVALTLDESGIPDTVQGRIDIAKKIIAKAAEYGIPKKDIIIDPLTMTISTGQNNANITLEAVSYIRNELGVHTVLGVSNISFGLPQREIINGAFFTMSLNNGLSAGIINPKSKAMMNAYNSYCALRGYDIACENYINAYSQTTVDADSSASNKTSALSLKDCVIKGLKEQARAAANELCTSAEALEIINNELIPALDHVGKLFESGKLYLPQLLMSADAARLAFDSIKTHLSQHGIQQEKRDKIIIATVKGDIHDIGKNIVKVLLENYCYDVIDLGKDVSPELIVKTAVEQSVRLVGLSALMTTTVVNMEKTIKLLRESTDCKIMVGGAVLTQSYAEQIGADFYSKDAMGSVNYANQLFGY